MNRKFLLFTVCLIAMQPIFAQRQMEKMDRGVVAMLKSSSQLFVSWRFFAADPDEISFNVYRQIGTATPVKLNSEPIINSTNLTANITSANTASRIFVKPVLNGVEGREEGSWNLPGNSAINRIVRDIDYHPLPSPEYDGITMDMKFCWVADLNGDGKYDYVIDRQNYGATSEEESNATDYLSPFVEAYTSEGEFMWRIKIGTNLKIDDGANDGVTAYDMDGDGFAEVMILVSEGAVFPDGQVITHADGTVHNYNSAIGSCPQWVAIVNGQTGNLIDTVGLAHFTEMQNTRTDEWKNINGRFVIMYLDGIHPSLLYEYKSRLSSGAFIGAFDTWRLIDGQLVVQWSHRFYLEDTQYDGHQVRVGDVDGDGKDEFLEVAFTIDHDGSLLYHIPGIAHGDRQYLADIDPDRPGLEHFFIQQSNIMGMGLNDAATGEIIKGFYLSSVTDVARSSCAAFDANRRGMQFWSTMNSYTMYDGKGNATGGTGVFPCEALWWGPNLSRWHVNSADGDGKNLILQKFNGSSFDRDMPNFYAEGGNYYLMGMYGKRAAFWGDMLGDWREEIILPRRDGTGFAVVSTWEQTNIRQYCLAQNPAYRGQTTAKGYYQTADVDFYMAADMPLPPVAPVQQADLYVTSGNTLTATAANGKSVMFDIRNPNTVITINEILTPDTLLIINPKSKDYEFYFSGGGKISGSGIIIKSLQGDVTLNGNHDYTGKTRISEGRMFINGEIQSPVMVNARGVIGGNGKLNAGITFETGLNTEGGRIEPGNGATLGTLEIVGDVVFPGRNNLHFDIDQTKPAKNDTLKITGDFTVTATNNTIVINQLSPVKADTLTLLTFTGTSNATAANFAVKGLEGIPYTLLFETNRICLALTEPRAAGVVTWSGAANGVWNFQTKNFLNNDNQDFFVPGDSVYFTDNAITKSITIAETMPVAGLNFSNTTNYSISGTGAISGAGGIKKTGAGKLNLSTQENSFTGGIDFADGILTVSSLKNGGLPSSIGASSNAAANWKMSNATLQTTAAMSTDRNMQVVGNLTVDNPTTSNSVFLSGNITGTNITLKLTGAGSLTMSGTNNFKEITVKSGNLISGSADANKTAFGSGKITLEGGMLQMYNVNTTSNTGPWTNEINIPEGKSSVWNLPQRWIFNNKISGAGTLIINAPYVRSDFNVDWSDFIGKVNFTGSDIRLNNSSARNMVNVHVELASGTNLYCASNGSGTISAQTITFGALSGAGNMNGGNTYIIGAKNMNTVYSGVIGSDSGSLIKNGTGVLTLTAANLFTGGVTVNAGALFAANDSGSATGTGDVCVNAGGTLTGTGTIAGNVIVAAGGFISAGDPTATDLEERVGTLNLSKNLTLQGGTLKLEAIRSGIGSYPCGKIAIAGNAVINGTVVVELMESTVRLPLETELTLLTVTGVLSGEVTSFILPATAPGTAWDTSTFLTNGKIRVITGETALDDIIVEKTIKSVEYFDFIGRKIPEETPGYLIRKIVFDDGTTLTDKIFNRQLKMK